VGSVNIVLYDSGTDHGRLSRFTTKDLEIVRTNPIPTGFVYHLIFFHKINFTVLVCVLINSNYDLNL
jgi:hypothetical protein